MEPVLPVEVPDGVGVRVDQSRQHGAVAQVHEARTGRHRSARGDAHDATSHDYDVDVVLGAASAVQNVRGADDESILS